MTLRTRKKIRTCGRWMRKLETCFRKRRRKMKEDLCDVEKN